MEAKKMDQAGSSSKIQLLNEINYQYLSLRVKGHLLGRKCWAAVEPEFGPNPTADQVDKDERALGVLYSAIDANKQLYHGEGDMGHPKDIKVCM